MVGCDVRRVNATLGFRIIVESQYPFQFVFDTIEKALADLIPHLDARDQAGLEAHKAALINFKVNKLVKAISNSRSDVL